MAAATIFHTDKAQPLVNNRFSFRCYSCNFFADKPYDFSANIGMS
jgi:hypothetical protein